MPLNVFKLAVLVSGRGSNLQAIIDSIEKEELDVSISIVISNTKDAIALKPVSYTHLTLPTILLV